MRRRRGISLRGALLGAALSALPQCGGTPTQPGGAVDLVPFKAMARDASCAVLGNRLFLIDEQLVFWDRVGSCPDASYARALFASTVDQVLCESHDSIGGPMGGCRDTRYREMFVTILANLDRPDLGLGPAHSVQPIPF